MKNQHWLFLSPFIATFVLLGIMCAVAIDNPVGALIIMFITKPVVDILTKYLHKTLNKRFVENIDLYSKNEQIKDIKLYEDLDIPVKYKVLGKIEARELTRKRAKMAMQIKAYEMGADSIIECKRDELINLGVGTKKEIISAFKHVMFLSRNDTYSDYFELPWHFYDGVAIKFEKEKKSQFLSKFKPNIKKAVAAA